MSSVRRAWNFLMHRNACIYWKITVCGINVVSEDGKAKGEEYGSDTCMKSFGASSTWNSSFISSRVPSSILAIAFLFYSFKVIIKKFLTGSSFCQCLNSFLFREFNGNKIANFCNGKNILIRYKKNSNDERCVSFIYNYDGSNKYS